MGRKSLEEQRREEILAAFERCIPKYGLEASLEQIADEAGVKRSLIRHYIGNREALVDELIARITGEYLAHVQTMSADVPATLDFLFADKSDYAHEDLIILQVLITAKDRYPQAKRSLQALFEALVRLFADDLAAAYPDKPAAAYTETAYLIIALSLGNESMMWLGMGADYHAAARRHAEMLLRQLEG